MSTALRASCAVSWVWQAIKGFRAKMEAGTFAIGPSIGLKDAVVTDAIAPEADFIWYQLSQQQHLHFSGFGRLTSPALAQVRPGALHDVARPAAEPHLCCARQGLPCHRAVSRAVAVSRHPR